jgi:hypothetical protein
MMKAGRFTYSHIKDKKQWLNGQTKQRSREQDSLTAGKVLKITLIDLVLSELSGMEFESETGNARRISSHR